MKKILLVAAVAGMAMASCKKDYTCECVYTTNSPGSPAYPSTSTKLTKMKKDDATKKCDEGDISVSSGQYTSTWDCSIK